MLTRTKLLLIIIAGFTLWGSSTLYFRNRNPFFHGSIDSEIIKKTDPDPSNADQASWEVLSYGYELGPWPLRFQDEPVVSTLTYQKGPPDKFIPEMNLIWSPTHAEIRIEGPRTPTPVQSRLLWKIHLGNKLFNAGEKKSFIDTAFPDLKPYGKKIKKISWFEGETASSPAGIHLQIDFANSQIDRYILITEEGITQNFTLTASKDSVGDDARKLFIQVLGAMNAKNTLSEPRYWMGQKLKQIRMDQIEAIQNPKLRYERLIQVRNELLSQLAVDPRSIAPFFHLAGIVHLLGISLIKEKKVYFKNQESWLVGTGPLLTGLIHYVKDFPDSGDQKNERDAALANMESLLEDFLLFEQRASQKI